MRVSIAGGTGVLGGATIDRLQAAGHDVTLTMRQSSCPRRTDIATVVVDFEDPRAVRTAIAAQRPDAVISLLSSLPEDIDPRKLVNLFREHDRVSSVLGRYLVQAAADADARPIVTTVSFWYEPGPTPADETTPLWFTAPQPISRAVTAMAELEGAVADAHGVVLRCGRLLGPGTYYDRKGAAGSRLAAGTFPIVGHGTGYMAFVHVEDAAAAIVLALTLPPGIYNAVDDRPITDAEWMPAFAEAYGGPAPRRIPSIAANFVVDRGIVAWFARRRAVSNEKLRAHGWEPQHPTWRSSLATTYAAD